MSAAKWHREQAARRDLPSAQCAHHATAADALEALAVGRLATWLARMAQAEAVYGTTMTDEERASLATLAKIARGE